MFKFNPYRIYHGEDPKVHDAVEGEKIPVPELPSLDTLQEAKNKIQDLPVHLKRLHIIYEQEEVPN